MSRRNEHTIRFVSLADGKHTFQFEADDLFFEQLDYSIIEGGQLKIDVEMDKSPTMLTVTFDIEGTIKVMCDKCTDNFDMEVQGSEELIYKFTEEIIDDEKIRTISAGEIEIDLTQPIYEFSALLLPNRRVHPEGECNQDMLEQMDQYLMVEADEVEESIEPDEIEEDETDPRWAALKKLKKK